MSILETETGPQVLPISEIKFDFPPELPKIMDFAAKWAKGSFKEVHTSRTFDFPPSDQSLLENLQELGKRCWKLCHLKGYVRIDFRIDDEGRPWLLEINANPYLDPDGAFVKACEVGGFNFLETISYIVSTARAYPSTLSGLKERA